MNVNLDYFRIEAAKLAVIASEKFATTIFRMVDWAWSSVPKLSNRSNANSAVSEHANK